MTHCHVWNVFSACGHALVLKLECGRSSTLLTRNYAPSLGLNILKRNMATANTQSLTYKLSTFPLSLLFEPC